MDDPVQSSVPSSQPTVNNDVLMGILAYLGILVIIPLIVDKSPFVKFHVKQGLVLFIIEIIISALGFGFYAFWGLINLLNLLVLILVIIGIVNVVNRKQQELPVVGQLAKYFTF